MALGQGYVAPDFDGSVIGISADVPSFEFLGQSSLVPSIAFGDGTPTFTRASGAAHTDFEGIVRQVPAGAARFQGARYVKNLLSRSDSLTAGAGWTVTNLTTVVGATAPDGTITAYTATATAGNGNLFMGPAGTFTGVGSWYVRRVSGSGAVKLIDAHADRTTISVTTTWQRFSTIAQTLTGNAYCGVELATSGDVVELWHPMVENVTSQINQNPSEYVPALATANADSGAIGVRYFSYLNGNTVASNVVTEAQGAAITSAAAECAGGVAAGVVDASGPLGYLAEGVRTNLILQSQTFDNAAWDVSTVSTIVADQTAAPDGTATADKLVEAAVTNNHFVRTTTGVTVTNGVVYTFSLFIKKGTRNWFSLSQDGTVKTFFNISTGVVGTVGAGTTATITALPNGWYRCSITFTQSGTTAILYAFNQTTDNEGAYLGVVTDYSYIWGAQLEAASFASSYIPTTTIAVARQADVLTFASAGNTSGTQGAAYAEVATFGATASVTNQVILGDSATNRQILGFTTQTNMRSFDGTNVNDWTISSVAGGAVHKFAASWGGIVESFFEDGAQISPATKPFDGNFDIGTIGIGTSNTSNQPFATIRNIRIYPTPPSASRAQAMTT